LAKVGPYDGDLQPSDSNLVTRLKEVEARIAAAVKRVGYERSHITLVAVTKKFSASAIREGYQAGLRDFGENYVQEFSDKAPQVQDLEGTRYHLIGHLQSNKVRPAIELFHLIQTVDSVKLLERLDRGAVELGKTAEALLEIKLSEEPNKTGASPQELPKLLDAASKCVNTRITGLMTVPPWSEDAELSRPYFRQLAELAQKFGLKRLSMGMSNEFEVAIEEGATIIRVGTALFGPRPKPAVPQA
jgi:pyridoxal phosphate enzyme (YggS family)